jgi:predicted transcriptional regulator
VEDLRRLLLRTLNDNQLLILSRVAATNRPLTGLLISLSRETGIPLSTLKLNARILRELNLISYGSTGKVREAEVEPVGSLVLRLMEADGGSKLRLYE